MKILIIKPSSFGDILHTMPAVQLLRDTMPDATIDWVVNDTFREVAALSPCVRKIIPFPRANGWKPWVFAKFLRELREDSYDIALDFQGLFRSGLIAWLSRSALRIGFAHAREGAARFYHQAIPVPDPHAHAAEKNLHLARQVFQLPTETMPTGEYAPPLQFSPEASSEADVLWENCQLPEDVIPVAVCYSSRWPSKNWSPDFFKEIFSQASFQCPQMHFLLIGGKNDIAMGTELCRHHANAHLLAGRTSFPGLTALLSRCKGMLTVDSGPMHLAAALGIPCTALFGSTDPVLTGPWGPEHFHRIFTTKCEKAPCFQRICPLGTSCDRQASPIAVMDHLRRTLTTH